MTPDGRLLERVQRVLAGRDGVAERRMVGGRSFLIAGSMCCGVAADALMVRVGADGMARALEEPHVRPMELGGRRLAGFVLVDPAACASDEALAAWVERGVACAAALPAARRRGRTGV